MTFNIRFFIIFTTFLLNYSDGARILGIFPVMSKSHFSMQQHLMETLAHRNHQVTVIGPYKLNSKIENYTEILLYHDLTTLVDRFTIEAAKYYGEFWNFLGTTELMEEIQCWKILYLPYIQNLILSKKKKIDLIVAEIHSTKCFSLLANKLNVPIIIILPPSVNIAPDYILGNPTYPSYVPSIFRPHTTKMNFFQRLRNAIDYCITHIHDTFIYHDLRKISRRVFKTEVPDTKVLDKQIAMAFTNNHFSLINRANTPNVLNVAGIHIKEAKALPEHLQRFIDESDQGVIFFSFGSTIRASTIDPEKLNVIKEVFSEIPQRILWRVDNVRITGLPPNVELATWFPQRDILEHKNVIAFITHGGMFSLLEAVYTETPVITVPFLFDQAQNMKIVVERGIGIALEYDDITKTSLKMAIDEIVNNTMYRETMKKYSQMIKDRPLSPMDEAIYWIEYVTRHNTTYTNLRPCIADIPMHQYLLLDVIAVVLITLISFFFLCKSILNVMLSIFRKHDREKYKTS